MNYMCRDAMRDRTDSELKKMFNTFIIIIVDIIGIISFIFKRMKICHK